MKKLFAAISVCVALASVTNATTYLTLTVEGVVSDHQVQGQDYAIEYDCAAGGSTMLMVINDLNANGVADSGEPPIFGSAVTDNAAPSGTPVYDSNAEAGIIGIAMVMHMPVGNWVIAVSENTTGAFTPLEVVAPEPLLYTVSGTIEFEGITTPDPSLAGVIVGGGVFRPPFKIMIFALDSMGDYSFNWPGDPGDLTVMIFGGSILSDYMRSDFNRTVTVAGFETGVDMFIRHLPDTTTSR